MTRSLLVRLAAALCGALVFLPVLAGDTLFYSDYSFIYHPLVRWATERMAAGEAPWWNPALGLGVPQVANPILGTFYPPNLLLIALPFDRGLGALLCAHVIGAMLASMWLLKELGVGPFAQLGGGVTFGLSGALVSSLTYAFPVFGWAWVPVALAGAARIAKERPHGLTITAVALGLIVLAGSPLGAAMALGLAVGLLVGLAPPRAAFRELGLAAALGLGLAAVQVLPTLAFLPESVRVGGADAADGIWSLAPSRLIGFAIPDFWGRWAPEMTFWGAHLTDGRNDGNFFFYSHYVGAGALVLSAVAVGQRETRRLAIALLVCGGISTWLALGRHGGAWDAALTTIPGFGMFRYPEKWLLPATLTIALCAGLGLHVLASRPPERAARAGGLVVCAIALAGGLVVLTLDQTLRATIGAHALAPYDDAARAVQVAGAWRLVLVSGVAGVAVAAWGRWGRWGRWLAPAIACVLLLDLTSAARDLIWTAPPELLKKGQPLLDEMNKSGAGAPVARHRGLDRVRLHRDLPQLIAQYERNAGTLRANSALEAGGRVLHAETPARLDHPLPPDEWLWQRPVGSPQILGVRHVLVPSGAPLPRSAFARVSGPGMDVGISVRTVDGPGLCVDAVIPVDHDEVVDAVLGTDPLRAATVEPKTAIGPTVDELITRLTAGSGGARACASQGDGDGDIVVRTERPTLLVLRRAFASGWSATVNGDEATILRAYGSLQSIPLPTGEHRIQLRYTPPGLAAGAAISLGSLLMLVLIALVRRRRAE